ncbi:MAG: haloacid dehalogenase [Dehalococcoidales bacterium]
MPRPTDNLESIAERARLSFDARDSVREKVLPLCREVIRHSSKTTRSVHRQEFEQARNLLESAGTVLNEASKLIVEYDEFRYSGFYRDAQKEYTEAAVTLALVSDKRIPAPEELGTDFAAYLNGLGEAAGEVRRFILDGIRREDLSRGEDLLEAMDDIYSILVSMDFPEAITAGLRRTTDMVRGVLERTRSDLTLVMKQNRLEEKLGPSRYNLKKKQDN